MPKNRLPPSFFDVSFFCSYLRSCCRRCFHPCHCHLYNSFFHNITFQSFSPFFFFLRSQNPTDRLLKAEDQSALCSRAFRSAASPRFLMSYLQLPLEKLYSWYEKFCEHQESQRLFFFILYSIEFILTLITPLSPGVTLINNVFFFFSVWMTALGSV